MAVTKEDFEKRTRRMQYEVYDEVCDVLKTARNGVKYTVNEINDFTSEHADADALYAYCTGGDLMELSIALQNVADIVLRCLPPAAAGADRLAPDDKTRCSICGR